MKQQMWKPLQPGDIVDIAAPGMPTSRSTLFKAKAFLKSWGLVGRYPREILGKDLLCSNSKAVREKLLKTALVAKDSRGVWCIRGGYGSFELLNALKEIKKIPPAKAFLGLSDITSLHHFLQQQWGWSTLHSSNMDRYALENAPQKESKILKSVLFGRTQQVEFTLKPLNAKARKKQSFRGLMSGGNLITCQATIGTPFEMQNQGKILFFEDIGERGYKVDRILKHFAMAGLLKGVRGVVFGEFVGGREHKGPSKVPKVMQAFADTQKFPVFSGLPCGHGKFQMPLPFGAPAKLSGGAKGILTVSSGVDIKAVKAQSSVISTGLL